MSKPTDIELRAIIEKVWRTINSLPSSAELVMSPQEWQLNISLYRRGWNDARDFAIEEATEPLILTPREKEIIEAADRVRERAFNYRNRKAALERAGIREQEDN